MSFSKDTNQDTQAEACSNTSQAPGGGSFQPASGGAGGAGGAQAQPQSEPGLDSSLAAETEALKDEPPVEDPGASYLQSIGYAAYQAAKYVAEGLASGAGGAPSDLQGETGALSMGLGPGPETSGAAGAAAELPSRYSGDGLETAREDPQAAEYVGSLARSK